MTTRLTLICRGRDQHILGVFPVAQTTRRFHAIIVIHPSARSVAAAALDSMFRCGYKLMIHDMGSYFTVRSKADTSQLNLPHGTKN